MSFNKRSNRQPGANIDDEATDVFVTSLLVNHAAPAVCLKLLRAPEFIGAIKVQAAAVEVLLSLAYDAHAIEAMLEKRVVPLLISVAQNYDGATGLVAHTLQTLTLLLKEEASGGKKRGGANTGGGTASSSSSVVVVSGEAPLSSDEQVLAMREFVDAEGVPFFLEVLEKAEEARRQANEIGDGLIMQHRTADQDEQDEEDEELEVSILTFLSTISRNAEVCAELGRSSERAVPVLMAFLRSALSENDDDEGRAFEGDSSGKSDAADTREQAVDVLKQLSRKNGALCEAIGEHGMDLVLHMISSSAQDSRVQLQYLELIRELTTDDSNVKALIQSEGVGILVSLLGQAHATFSGGLSKHRSGGAERRSTVSRKTLLLTGMEAERLAVKLEVMVLEVLLNMATADSE